MNRTLEDVLKDQDNVLSAEQANRILDLYVRLGRDLGIAHNDPNVTRNLMTNAQGEFMLIDFGFAKIKKMKSVGLNGGLVARVMDRLKDGSKGKKVLSNWIRKTEKSENRVVDVRGKVKRDLRRRKLERLAKIVG